MKVLFFHNGSDLYGASRSFLRLTSRLVKDGVWVKAVLPQSGPLHTALMRADVEVSVMDPFPIIERTAFKSARGLVRLFFSTPISIARVCRLIRDFKPDVIHSNLSVLFTPAIAARIKHIPHVWHIRESYAEFGFFWKLYQRFMVWGADQIISVSSPIAAQFEGHLRETVQVIHNGFPKSEFEPVPLERVKRFKAKYKLNDETLVGIVGRIKYVRKGQEYVVQAAARLKDRFPGVKYLLIGSPFLGNEDHLERLQRLINELDLEDRIVYTGDVEDVKAAYASLDISVVASGLPEPFAGVTIESMAMGKPVVGTRLGGTIEQIEEGVTGLLVPPRDANALADALATLLDNPERCQQMGRAGHHRFLNHFEFEPFYHKVCAVYEEVTR